MRVRTDSVLKSLLLELHERAHAEVAPHLMDALDLMGDRSPYKGGQRLLDLLEFVEREAAAVEDTLIVDGARDAVAYATGRLLDNDLRVKYTLYDWSGQSDIRHLERHMSGLQGLTAAEAASYLADHPDASAAELLAHLQEQSTLALRFVRARRAGHYGAFRIRTEGAAWLTDVFADRTTFLKTSPLPAAPEHLLAAAQIQLRLAKLDELEQAVTNPFTKERHLQRLVERSPWLFGGEYIGMAEVRRLSFGNEVDVALLRPDGVLHVVELKRANVQVVKTHRGAVVPTAEVHDAVSQVFAYLRDFDEQRADLLDRYGLDARRAGGTVVIGHPQFDTAFTAQQVNEALRSYTSQLSRVDVITYQQLVDGARRTLQLAEDA